MKNLMYFPKIAAFLLAISFLASCTKDAATVTAFQASSSFTLVNTIQIARPDSLGGTNGKETPVELLFHAPAGSLAGKATLNETAVEMPNYITLWDIDFTSNSITFKNLINSSNQPFPGYLRTIEVGTFDRYYLTVSPNFTINNISTDITKGLKVEKVSDSQLVITMGEGYDNSQSSFKVTFN